MRRMQLTSRTPAGDLIVDLRSAQPPDVAEGTIFGRVAEELAQLSFSPRIRVWVLHDAAQEWCAQPALLRSALTAWLAAAARGPLAPGAAEVVVLSQPVVSSRALVAVMQSLGLPVHTVRRGGGLPLSTVELEGAPMTALTSRALPPEPLPTELAPVVEALLGS